MKETGARLLSSESQYDLRIRIILLFDDQSNSYKLKNE